MLSWILVLFGAARRGLARTVASGIDVNPLRNRRRSDMTPLLKFGGIIVEIRGITLTEFYQQNPGDSDISSGEGFGMLGE
jgi:hypothetical protein